jgi:hypothetical protein
MPVLLRDIIARPMFSSGYPRQPNQDSFNRNPAAAALERKPLHGWHAAHVSGISRHGARNIRTLQPACLFFEFD